MNPILKYLKDVFATNRIRGNTAELMGMAKADALLHELVNQKRVPGLAITVLKEGTTIFQRGYGFADLEQKKLVDPQQTIFRIASVSKPIAATALACMVQEGIIDLDASFYNYVPYYPKKRWDFTIRQLASHTAGIRGYQGKEYGLNKPYGIKESLDIFKEDKLLFQPGHGFLYNSFDWVLISLAMQEASGIPFEEYVKSKVLKPLGMQNTFAPLCHPERSRGLSNTTGDGDTTALGLSVGCLDQTNVAVCYSKSLSGFKEAIPVNNFYKLAAGGYLSTSEDIAKFGQAYLNQKLLDQDIRSQFLSSQKINGKSTYYGLGWQVSEDAKGRKFYGHIGNGVGGYSNFFVYPEEQMVFSILINCTDPKIQEELDVIINELFI
jgi:CubicO group peptidase (beta-lactamase class C family)